MFYGLYFHLIAISGLRLCIGLILFHMFYLILAQSSIDGHAQVKPSEMFF